jgi:hypothetical protein
LPSLELYRWRDLIHLTNRVEEILRDGAGEPSSLVGRRDGHGGQVDEPEQRMEDDVEADEGE